MRFSQFLAIVFISSFLMICSAQPYQGYRTYRSPLRDGTFDHASMFRFTSDGGAGSGQKLPRDYPYAQIQYGASSPLYVFDGRLYNLASARS
uniref:Secreted protein n=1 Tax=Caenorhabditis tropicalis TaxID=1561998 RepID=A0A1I7T5C4_9PELO